MVKENQNEFKENEEEYKSKSKLVQRRGEERRPEKKEIEEGDVNGG